MHVESEVKLQPKGKRMHYSIREHSRIGERRHARTAALSTRPRISSSRTLLRRSTQLGSISVWAT
jgi:hypothetical protein